MHHFPVGSHARNSCVIALINLESTLAMSHDIEQLYIYSSLP